MEDEVRQPGQASIPQQTDELSSPPALPDRDPVWTYEDLLIFLAISPPCFLAGFVLLKAIVYLTHTAPAKPLEVLPAQFLGYLFWFACLWLILKTRYDIPFRSAMHWKLRGASILPALANGLGLAIVIAIVGTVLRTPAIDSPMQEMMRDPASRWLIAVLAVTLGPVCEELAFRGFLLPLLARTFGAAIGIVLTAIPFALLHGPQYAWSWRHILLILLAGCAFGWIRLRTGSTAISAVTHGAYNCTFLLVYFLQRGSTIERW